MWTFENPLKIGFILISFPICLARGGGDVQDFLGDPYTPPKRKQKEINHNPINSRIEPFKTKNYKLCIFNTLFSS